MDFSKLAILHNQLEEERRRSVQQLKTKKRVLRYAYPLCSSRRSYLKVLIIAPKCWKRKRSQKIPFAVGHSIIVANLAKVPWIQAMD